MLEKCLTALYRSLFYKNSCQVIVGDNGSTDNTADVLSRFPIDTRIKSAVNTGLELYRELFAAAQGDYIIDLDDDVLDLPKYFDLTFEEYFRAYPEYGLLGLDVVQNEHTNGAKPGVEHYRNDARGMMTVEEGPVIGCCLCVKRATFVDVGGFAGATLSMALGEDAILYGRVKSKAMRAGILKGVTCFHASGPVYSKQFGLLERDVEKYIIGNLPGFAHKYNTLSKTDTTVVAKVSIIIPVFNRVELTRQCLEALFALDETHRLANIIVVDNASTDDTANYLASLDNKITVIRNPNNMGFAHACNQGAEVSSGQYVVFLNNDTIPLAGWLEALVRGAEQDNADIVGAKLLYPDRTVQHAGVVFLPDGLGSHLFCGFSEDHPAVNKKRWLQAVTGACLLISRNLFIHLGCFDEAYVNGFEDIELCCRATLEGRRILYTPESVLFHLESATPGRKVYDDQNARLFLYRWQGKIGVDYESILEAEGLIHPIGMANADKYLHAYGNSNMAMYIFASILKHFPDDAGAMLNLSKHLISHGLTNYARTIVDDMIKLDPANREALLLMQHVLSKSSENRLH